MLVPPKDPTQEKPVSFLEAVEDKHGHLKNYYILQHALKKYSGDYHWWQILPQGAYFRPGFIAEEKKFEADKARYLETGELPEEY